MTIRHLFSDVTPALNLDFANTKRLDPRITFTRGSTGTYVDEFGVIKTAASNEARFDHDGGGNSLGLLIEESKTNLHAYSEEFDNAAWVKANVNITANSTTAPDGTSTADTLNCTSGGQTFQHIRKSATTTATSYTFSCFVKAGNISTIRLGGESYTKYATFTLTGDGSYSSVTSGASASIVPLPNGWYRCTLTYTASSGTYVNDIRFSSAALNDYVYIWGAQLETGSFPTSYIPTTSSTATRSADVASMTGTNFSSWYNVNEGTWFGFISTLSGNAGRLVEVTGPGASDYSMSIRPRASSARVDFARFNSGSPNVSTTFPAKMAASYNSSSIQGAVGGTLATLLTSGSHSNSTAVNIGRIPAENTYLGGTISRLTYYDRRLTDAQLQALTL